jgi:hypothetical protein
VENNKTLGQLAGEAIISAYVAIAMTILVILAFCPLFIPIILKLICVLIYHIKTEETKKIRSNAIDEAIIKGIPYKNPIPISKILNRPDGWTQKDEDNLDFILILTPFISIILSILSWGFIIISYKMY